MPFLLSKIKKYSLFSKFYLKEDNKNVDSNGCRPDRKWREIL